MKHLQSFNEHLNQPSSMQIGHKYKITEPNYDELPEPDSYLVELEKGNWVLF